MTRGQIAYFVGIVLVFIALVIQSVYTHAEKTIYLEDGSTVITDDNVFVFEGELYTLLGAGPISWLSSRQSPWRLRRLRAVTSLPLAVLAALRRRKTPKRSKSVTVLPSAEVSARQLTGLCPHSWRTYEVLRRVERFL